MVIQRGSAEINLRWNIKIKFKRGYALFNNSNQSDRVNEVENNSVEKVENLTMKSTQTMKMNWETLKISVIIKY